MNKKDLKNIKAAVFDIDGTMTNGNIWFGENGQWKRCYSVLDGAGIVRLSEAGYTMGVITAAESEDIKNRVKHLKINYFYEKSRDKLKDFYDFLSKTKLTSQEVCYIGDDIFDLPVLKVCGFSACPKNAISEVQETSNYVTKSPGGFGAVRELCDLLIKYGYYSF